MSVQSTVPCRLWVFMARRAKSALIVRRGPARWAELILWDTKKDRFERGQWFHGRIYEERCDLSPDGTKFIYFAAKYGRKRDVDIPDTWTAVSKPPYFTALALWPGLGTWGGGGVFLDDQCLWRADWPEKIHRRFSLNGLIDVLDSFDRMAVHSEFLEFERTVRDPLYLRLHQSGWELREPEGASQLKWKKENPVRRCHLLLDRSFSPSRYHLVLSGKGSVPQSFDAEWADWDQQGRLVIAHRGKLLAGKWDRHRGLRFEELVDFNEDHPVSIEAPEWAKRW
jgi:hypothetical protein